MKILVTLAMAAVTLVGAVPYPASGTRPQGALLVLPSQVGTSARAQPRTDESQNLESVNEQVMEQLRQVEGSERGVYHVYLPDGRLQRVQYTSAPLRAGGQGQSTTQQATQQNSQVAQNANGFQYSQQNAQANAGYYSAQTGESSQSGQYAQQNGQRGQEQLIPGQVHYVAVDQLKGRLVQQQAGGEVSQQQQGYLPVEPRDSQGAPSEQPGQSAQLNVISVDQLREYLGGQQSRNQEYRQSNGQDVERPSGYLASLQYTDVEPIRPPIYSYNSAAPLTRILRYAPQYL